MKPPTSGALGPADVVTETVLVPSVASAAMVMLAVICVALTPVMLAVTPVPEKVTAVAPVRLVPLMATAIRVCP